MLAFLSDERRLYDHAPSEDLERHRAALRAFERYMREKADLQRAIPGSTNASAEWDAALRSAYLLASARVAEEYETKLGSAGPPGVQRIEDLPVEDKQGLAMGTAATINQGLVQAFLRLGPPPERASGDITSAPSGGGGAEQ